jgi:hypothetical protein
MIGTAGVGTLGFLFNTPPAPDPIAVAVVPSAKTTPSPSYFTDEASTPTPAASQEDLSTDLLKRLQDKRAAGGNPDADADLRKLLADLVKIDPAAAAEFAESVPIGHLRDFVMRCVALDWALKDPQGAEKWASQLRDRKEKTLMLSNICYQLAEADPAQAIQTAERVDLQEQKYGMVQNVAQQWAAQDFSAASAWILQQPAGAQRNQLLMQVVLVQSQINPESAAVLVAENIPPGPIQDEAALTVVVQWAKNDRDGAKAWVESFSSGPLRQRAENQLASLADNQK